MITQNSLSRKQHSSGNRKSQIILSYNWKPHRFTSYASVSQFSSGAPLDFKFAHVTQTREGGMAEKINEGKNLGNAQHLSPW